LGFGHVFADSHPGISSNDGSYCAYNDIIDCDSYLNYDTDNRGSDADGFACKMHNGKKNRFIRCRAWDNSDDAWDLYETDFPVYMIECWAWGSGRASNFNVVGGSFQGNGNGIKLGGNGTGGNSKGKHEAWYCFAFNNNKTTSVKGFDQNSHQGGVKLINCVAFGNGYDYMFETASGVREFYNDICFGRIELASGTIQGNNAIITNPDAGWTNNVCSTFTTADFNSLTEANAKSARGADGSMPTSFGRLVAGSVLIDKGTVVSNGNAELSDLGLPRAYVGANRDLGAYEYSGTPKLSAEYASGTPVAPYSFNLLPNYPNPFNPSTTIQFHVASEGPAVLKVYNALGQEVATLFSSTAEPGRLYSIQFQAERLASGMYFSVLESGLERQVRKMIFVK
jgi:pectate disaccharide-lyase